MESKNQITYLDKGFMRYLLSLVFSLLFFMSGCRQPPIQESSSAPSKKKQVLSTTGIVEGMVREIGEPWIESKCLMKSELDPHSYELVKGDREKFEQADLLFFNGLGLEHSLSLRQQIDRHPCAIAVTQRIELEPENLLYVEGHVDPHVWMDVSLWIRGVDVVVEALSRLDPAHEQDFVARGISYKKELSALDDRIYTTIQQIPASSRVLITSHDAFHYFVRRYFAEPGEINWDYRCAAPEGLAPDAQLSLKELYRVLDLIRTHQVTVLFPESNVSRDALKKLLSSAKAEGISITLAQSPLYGDTLGGASNYIEMMDHNTQVIFEELQPQSDAL